ncbi:usherin isoform X2 [Syngnathoides biaculeatus]|uniref:usherin isoform X2 n=1 Tax=Syngnathoides biaculeatus TaxID=300417 RepID=UPI002ADDFF59|nr:usherin isoform X2 [Syngnathoides biaculeatus]
MSDHTHEHKQFFGRRRPGGPTGLRRSDVSHRKPGKDPKTDLNGDANLSLPTAPEGPMSGERVEADQDDRRPVFQELWFIAVMAAVALLLMAIVLGVVLHKALNKAPLTRGRPPLVAMKTRSPMAVYPAGNSVLFDTSGVVSSVTLKSFTMKMEEALEAKCEDAHPRGVEEGGRRGNRLKRSVSQVMDGKSPVEAWAPAMGHDSGMFMDDEEFVDSVKGFSTVRKEHTMFIDTNV